LNAALAAQLFDIPAETRDAQGVLTAHALIPTR